MSKIKKAFQPIIDLLEANIALTVEEILPQVVELAAAKVGGGGAGKATTFHRNEAGEVVAIKCYYYGVWMDPRVVEFGAKANSASKFNSMCKEGVSQWTKQSNEAKKAEAGLLDLVVAGELAADDIPAAKAEIEETRKQVVPREDGYGFATLEECLADSEARGLEV